MPHPPILTWLADTFAPASSPGVAVRIRALLWHGDALAVLALAHRIREALGESAAEAERAEDTARSALAELRALADLLGVDRPDLDAAALGHYCAAAIVQLQAAAEARP